MTEAQLQHRSVTAFMVFNWKSLGMGRTLPPRPGPQRAQDSDPDANHRPPRPTVRVFWGRRSWLARPPMRSARSAPALARNQPAVVAIVAQSGPQQHPADQRIAIPHRSEQQGRGRVVVGVRAPDRTGRLGGDDERHPGCTADESHQDREGVTLVVCHPVSLPDGETTAVRTIPSMIIWLNGPFGVGKTSVARELVGLIPDARIVDPERIGYVMKRTFWRHHDYQDVALWRRLTVRQVHRRARRTTVIVPMTVVDPAVYAEITAGARVFALTASREQITARIDAGDEAHDVETTEPRPLPDRVRDRRASANGSTPTISARGPSPRGSARRLLHGERAVRFGEFEVGTTTAGVAFGQVASDPGRVALRPDPPRSTTGRRWGADSIGRNGRA